MMDSVLEQHTLQLKKTKFADESTTNDGGFQVGLNLSIQDSIGLVQRVSAVTHVTEKTPPQAKNARHPAHMSN